MSGAPMSHYNAINGSRFSFSHDDSYLPIHALFGIIKEENVSMRFRIRNGKQVAWNKALNYFYRPTPLEEMSPYRFWSETEFINISQAKRDGIKYFEYTDSHLFCHTEAVVYRKSTAVPTFPWNWLGSTKSFLTSMLHPTDFDTSDHNKKQEYALRFMLLFVPYRSKEDLQTDGCYQNAFQRFYREKRITNEMIEIAENIQTIHNSLAAGIVENTLSAETALVEAGNLENTNEDDNEENYDALLASVGELFASLTNSDGLQEDSKTIDVKYGNKDTEATVLPDWEMETVIEYSESAKIDGDWQQNQYPPERFVSTKNNLNTLSLQTTITRVQANENSNETEREIINANGTWQSISKWGKNDGLDEEQQTAFEILAAMYVLSFYDEATLESTNPETSSAFNEKKKGLCILARRNTDSDDPLCMFITGPAGAGKCKSRKT
jgi:hypothetical protein